MYSNYQTYCEFVTVLASECILLNVSSLGEMVNGAYKPHRLLLPANPTTSPYLSMCIHIYRARAKVRAIEEKKTHLLIEFDSNFILFMVKYSIRV